MLDSVETRLLIANMYEVFNALDNPVIYSTPPIE